MATRTFGLSLEGHLSARGLEQALAPAQARLVAEESEIALVVDCSTMTGYDTEARVAFVDWARGNHRRLARIAIVTDNSLWHMVISAMRLASGMEMKAFSQVGLATAWAEGRD